MKSRWKTLGKIFAVVAILYAISGVTYSVLHKESIPSTPTVQSVQEVKQPEVSDIDPAILLSETNNHRVANGLTPVTINEKLNLSALTKCSDMVARNYWGHDTPDGQKPWVFITNTGYKYSEAGENQAFGYKDAQSVVTEWKKSPKHNENLLIPQHTEVGFGVCKSPKYIGGDSTSKDKPAVIVIQHFARPYGQ